MGPAPIADRKPNISDHHGTKIEDPYHWIRDPDWQSVMREPETLQPKIRQLLEAENAYTEAVLGPIGDLRSKLTEELKARIRQDDSSVPSPDGPFSYYRRFVPDGQYPVLCRRPREDEDNTNEQVLIDGNAAAVGKSFFSIGGTAHSPDHRLFACALDRNGSEYCEIGITDLATGNVLSDILRNAQGDMEWSADSKVLFYTVLDDNHRPSRIMRHLVGTLVEEDTLVYEETDPGFFLGIGKTESGRFIVIDAHDHADTSEVRLIDAAAPMDEPRLLLARITGVTYDVSDDGNRLIIRTNAPDGENDAVDFRIVETPIYSVARDNWQNIVPHRPGCLIRSMILFKGYLVRLEREQAQPRIVIRALENDEEHEISFDEEAYDLLPMSGYEYATTTLRFSYSSPTTPIRVYDYDLAARTRVIRKEHDIPSGHDPEKYECRRISAKSADGMQVPVTVLRAKTTPVDGSAPMLLYGYGSYGFAMPASFSSHVFSLVDRGFVYAIAHIRGGTENGQNWHLDGKLKHKRNTFDDFIAAADHLITENFTSAGNIVAQGRSAGGMLMGAVANMRPDLFSGILGEVPFVDVINTMCDETLPLTPPEWVEWGDPIRDKEAFDYMSSYCPYTNVGDRAYPNVLATGGLTDPRVTYWEPAKWAAKLRYHNTGDSKILLYMNMDAGHGGASGRFDRLKEIALSYGFALMVAGRS
jgi:oligopeptidase B